MVLVDKFKHVRGDSEAKERLILELQVRGGKYYFQIMLNKSVACVHSGPGAREGHHGAVQVPEEVGVRGQLFKTVSGKIRRTELRHKKIQELQD